MPLSLPLPHADIPEGIEIEGHAIVSADGMISDADGNMPPALRNDADWERFQAALDRSTLVVLGRLGHLRHPNTGRCRLVFTSSVAGLARDPEDPAATFFNPAGASLGEALTRLRIGRGTIAVTGGTGVFAYFLPLYHRFSLAEANGVILPEGRPCFAAGHPRAVLAAAGLSPDAVESIAAGVTLTQWARPVFPSEDACLDSAGQPIVAEVRA